MRLFKQTYRAADGTPRETPKWYIEFRDHCEKVRRWPGFTDKARTAEYGRKIEALVRCRLTGDRPDPDVSRWLERLPGGFRTKLAEAGLLDRQSIGSSKPLSEHLDDFAQSLRTKGNTERHVELVTGRARRVMEGCGFAGWSEVSASSVAAYLHSLREDQVAADGTAKRGISVQTFNFYLQAVKQFCRWMVQDRRAVESPVAHLTALNVRTDRRHDRRSLDAEELGWLLDTTYTGPERAGMTGPERSVLYRLAAESGLRAAELRSLTRQSFNLDPEAPTVTVEAGYSKRRRRDTLPLRPDTAAAIAEHLATKTPQARAFAMPSSDNTAGILRADLAAARDAWLADAGDDGTERKRREESGFLRYQDDSGRFADFHALRHTFISNLRRAGVHPKTAQELARHSTITLTMDRYTHDFHGDHAHALAALPSLDRPRRERKRATGTDGPSAGAGEGESDVGDASDADKAEKRWAFYWASRLRKHVSERDRVRQSPRRRGKVQAPENRKKTREKQANQAAEVGFERAVNQSHLSDSNRRPAVYKTAALPTELRWPDGDCPANRRLESQKKPAADAGAGKATCGT